MTQPCAYEKDDGVPCKLPGTRPDGRCHHHTDAVDDDSGGRPRAFDDERKQQIVYTAANSGLTIEHQASLAQVSANTLRRALCCIDTPRKATITAEDPCGFCEGYAQAHARGAMNVLDECRPEFRASASFGYVERKEQDITADVDADHSIDAAEGVTADFVTYDTEDIEDNADE